MGQGALQARDNSALENPCILEEEEVTRVVGEATVTVAIVTGLVHMEAAAVALVEAARELVEGESWSSSLGQLLPAKM